MEVEEGDEVDEIDDEECASLGFFLARNATNFGMVTGASIHLGEYGAKQCCSARSRSRDLPFLRHDRSHLHGPSANHSPLRHARAKMRQREHSAVGKVYPAIDDSIRKFIEAQPVFFVGSAPLDSNGHVNVSPKGLDTLRILTPTTVAYLDLTGSGIETVSHLKENGRIVLMFCAFQGPPKILRLHGHGTVIEPGEPQFEQHLRHFPEHEGTRTIIVIQVSRIADSCGFGVPLLEFKKDRDQLSAWARKLDPEGLKTYREERNSQSIDCRPALRKRSTKRLS
jgi:Pyridoxamine 5'-phosphate oxidase